MKLSRIAVVALLLCVTSLGGRTAHAWRDGDLPASAVSALPSVFDLRDLDAATPVKQQLGGTCWTHGAVAAIESHMIVSGFSRGAGLGESPALSEYHLDWWNGFNKFANEDLPDPAKDSSGMTVHQGGDYRVTSAYLSRCEGVVTLPRGHDVFRDNNWYQKAPPRTDPGYQRFYVRDVEWYTIGDNLENIDVIKKRIMTDGAVATCYAAGRYTSKDNIHYQPASTQGDPNHAVAIVGWDDAKISTDEPKKAPKPGAWLIKNSWGTRRGDRGYYWISYYDKHSARHPEMGAVSFRNIEPMVYTNVYYHDYHGWRDTLKDVSKALNAFTATGRQLVRAVSFFTAKHDVRYTIRIVGRFEGGKLEGERATQSGFIPFTGFHTINLDVPVLVNKGDKFLVCVELSDGGHAIDRTSQIPVLLEQQPPADPKTQPPADPKSPPKGDPKAQPPADPKAQPPADPKAQPGDPKAQPGDPKAQPGQRRRAGGGGGKPWVISKAEPGQSFYYDGGVWKDLYEYKFSEAKFDKTANFCIKALAVSAEESPYVRVAAVMNGLEARSIGPANMGGRITDLEAVESNPETIYVAAATGGVWKTTDAGNSWAPIFDQQSTQCIGDIAVFQPKPEIVWVGTGEANARNSVSWGDGIYKSTDAGKTWQNMGLRETRHIGRVVVHPTNPDIVYVAALGHIWGANRDRGIWKTVDGGKVWQKVKYIDENTGFIDMAIDQVEPETLYAAAYQVRRDSFSGGNPKTQTGPQAGLYKTTDGGKTWAKMTNGLPTGPYGRCGLAVYRKDPKVVYAVVQTDKTPTSARGTQPKVTDDVETGGVFRSEDKGQSWVKVNDLCPRPFYYGQIRVDPENDKTVYVLGISFHASEDGGKSFETRRGTHPDHHALWINPKDPKHLILGNDGGLYFSKDQGKAWDAIRGLPVAQFYGVAVDMRQPYRVYGGLQDNGSWGGASATSRAEGITLADWRRVAGSDGFQCAVDPTDPETVYAESQYGGLQRINLKSNERPKRIKPAAAEGQPAYRFNWNSPLVLSPHNPKTLYFGGNFVFKSENQGDKWEVISPDLTAGQPGPSTYSGHTITTLVESPIKAGVMWAGTDDGKLHVSKDGGKNWIDLTEKIPGVPKERWFSKIECSHYGEGAAYVAIDRHRNDDLRPYLFKTTDFGATWTKIMDGLPEDAPVQVVRESSKNKDLLFVGTENGLFASLDAGRRWYQLKNNLPAAVPVHDLVIHPRDRELVIGTHGRGVYVMDIAPLEELSPKILANDAHLFDVKSVAMTKAEDGKSSDTGRAYRAPNPPAGATISYYLRHAIKQPVSVTVTDADGRPVMSLAGATKAGLHRVVWDLKGNGGNGNSNGNGHGVAPGLYKVVVKVGGETLTKEVSVTGAE